MAVVCGECSELTEEMPCSACGFDPRLAGRYRMLDGDLEHTSLASDEIVQRFADAVTVEDLGSVAACPQNLTVDADNDVTWDGAGTRRSGPRDDLADDRVQQIIV